MEILKELSTTPLPVILVLCGMFLLAIALLPMKLTIVGELSARQKLISTIIGIISVFLGVVLYFIQTVSPVLPIISKDSKITIMAPPPNFDIAVQSTGGNGGIFKVKGTVSPYEHNSDLRVIVLVHSSKPYVQGWWIQPPAVINEKGDWQTDAQIGSNYYPPNIGDELDIMALVVNNGKIGTNPHVDDINNLEPITQSDVSSFVIKEIR